MSADENKAIVARWFTEFWGKEFNPAVIDELAAPDIRFEGGTGSCNGGKNHRSGEDDDRQAPRPSARQEPCRPPTAG